MRRKEKEIQDRKTIEAIIKKASVCHLAMAVDNRPYVIPLCFGYKDNTLYFHSADEGKKLTMIQQNPQVCFQLHVDEKLLKAEKACHWSMSYQSVIGSGKAVIVSDQKEISRALDVIMNQYAEGQWSYPQGQLAKTRIIRVDIEEMTGKQSLD